MTTEEKLDRLLASQGVPKLSRPAILERWSKEVQAEMAALVDKDGAIAPDAVTKFAHLRTQTNKQKVAPLPVASEQTEKPENEEQ